MSNLALLMRARGGRARSLYAPGFPWACHASDRILSAGFNHQPFPIIGKDIKSGWLIAKVMLAFRLEGRGPFSFQVVSLVFFLDQL